MKEAIKKLGFMLYELNCVIYLSSHLIRVYNTKVKPELEHHHPLPPFQASLHRILPMLVKGTKSRKLLCKIRTMKEGVKFHILEKTRVQHYNVDDVGLAEEEDKEVLKIALAAASRHEKVFLVTADRHFLEGINRARLLDRYQDEGQKIEIVTPKQFYDFLIAKEGEQEELKRRLERMMKELVGEEEKPKGSENLNNSSSYNRNAI
jgi:predicted nucleic acid-binding protein